MCQCNGFLKICHLGEGLSKDHFGFRLVLIGLHGKHLKSRIFCVQISFKTQVPNKNIVDNPLILNTFSTLSKADEYYLKVQYEF